MERKKILIVDDNEDLSKGLRVLLRAHDYSTVLAADAVSAISQAKNERLDLILLDLGLPAGDGFKVMERLGNADSLVSIPVIVLSVRDQQANKERSLKVGARVFVQKLVDNVELLVLIKRVLEESS